MEKIIKAAIIDDELHCLKTLQHQIERHCSDVQVVFSATDPVRAKSLVDEWRPDILFLDIEMPGVNGIQFLAQFDTFFFKVIFTTAYDQYAVKAIRLNALDYLLKPVNRQQLREAVEKFRTQRDTTIKEQVSQLHVFKEKKLTDTIALSAAQGLIFVKIGSIMYLEAENCYTHVKMNDGSKYLVSKTLANFADILSGEQQFFRAHKAFLINLSYIKKYIRGDGGEIIMHDESHIALSRNNKERFLKLFIKV